MIVIRAVARPGSDLCISPDFAPAGKGVYRPGRRQLPTYSMPDFASFFLSQAKTSPHVKFVYDLTVGRVVFVNAAYGRVFPGTQALVNEELPGLLARLHPDDRAYLAHYWARWVQNQVQDEVEIRFLHPGQPNQWFCLTPSYQVAADGHVLLGGTLRDVSVMKRYQENADLFNSRKNATLEILSHDLSGAFIMVEQIATFLREEVAVPLNSRVPKCSACSKTPAATA